MNQLEAFRNIHTFIFDVDGVMTNNEILVFDDGQMLRKLNARDGLAMKSAIMQGFRVAVITGGKSEGVLKRLKNLGLTDVYIGVRDKLAVFEAFLNQYKLDPGAILFMGDDITDHPVMRRVGLATCPLDAVEDIKSISQYISPFKGGEGCVRDVIEKTLRIQGKWDLSYLSRQ